MFDQSRANFFALILWQHLKIRDKSGQYPVTDCANKADNFAIINGQPKFVASF